jgi:hypothetical protein
MDQTDQPSPAKRHRYITFFKLAPGLTDFESYVSLVNAKISWFQSHDMDDLVDWAHNCFFKPDCTNYQALWDLGVQRLPLVWPGYAEVCAVMETMLSHIGAQSRVDKSQLIKHYYEKHKPSAELVKKHDKQNMCTRYFLKQPSFQMQFPDWAAETFFVHPESLDFLVYKHHEQPNQREQHEQLDQMDQIVLRHVSNIDQDVQVVMQVDDSADAYAAKMFDECCICLAAGKTLMRLGDDMFDKQQWLTVELPDQFVRLRRLDLEDKTTKTNTFCVVEMENRHVVMMNVWTKETTKFDSCLAVFYTNKFALVCCLDDNELLVHAIKPDSAVLTRWKIKLYKRYTDHAIQPTTPTTITYAQYAKRLTVSKNFEAFDFYISAKLSDFFATKPAQPTTTESHVDHTDHTDHTDHQTTS